MNTSDARVMAYVNMATEELMNEYDFPSVIDRLRFKITDRKITLPPDYDRAMLMNIDCVPAKLQSPWFEFVGIGPETLGEWNAYATDSNFFDGFFDGVLDKDQVGAFRDAPSTGGPYTIRVYGQVDEKVDGVRPSIVIQGYDANNKWIRSQVNGEWIDGVSVEINGDTSPFYVDSSQTITEVTAISKPVTNGQVYLYASPTMGGTPTHIGTYAPKDTQPFYRRYKIPCFNPVNSLGDDCPLHVLVRARKKYVPITQDGDYLIISNLPAMKLMVQAVYFAESGNLDQYLAYKQRAVEILKNEAKAYIGLQRTKPLVTFSEQMGVGGYGTYIL